MKLYELTTTTNDDGTRLVLVSGRVADHRDQAEQKEWISFQLVIDLTITRNGGLLRQAVLNQASDILSQLAREFETIGRRPPQ